jgi:hypothetical protein
MSKIVTADRLVLMVQKDGKGTELDPLSIARHGMSEKVDATKPGRGVTYGRDVHGRYTPKVVFKEAPTGLNTGTIEFEQTADIDFLEEMAEREDEFGIWEFYNPCLRLDNVNGWLRGGRLDYLGRVTITGGITRGAGPNREAAGTPKVNSAPVTWEYSITLLPPALTAQTTAEANDLLAITGLSDPKTADCLPGYTGPDKTLYIGAAAAGGAPASILYTRNGGGTWAAVSASPFGNGEDVGQLVSRIVDATKFRLVAGRTTVDAGSPAKIAYSDVSFGAEGVTAWTSVNVGATNGETVQVLAWPFPNRLYAAVAGRLYISTNNGASFTQIAGGSTAIRAIAKAYGDSCDDIFVVGASNLIRRERSRSGQLETLVGPTGGGDFHSVAASNDGLLYAGNGTKLFVSNNGALNTGGWRELTDFGANHRVVDIFLPRGDSQLIRVTVEDTTGAVAGKVWLSVDGGNSFNDVPSLANDGYNAVYNSSEDVNRAVIVGDANATPLGQIHQISPSTAGC